ncbi:MAG: sulfur carrier protein ThiS [Muribaculaceae bacterium]|nr:sulfur carrier protein ThiS [Muribaculaceae bacterium]
MNITVNNKPQEMPEGSTVADLARQQGVADGKGVAIAMNGAVVRRDVWESTPLSDGATIVLIKAAYGG